MIARKRRLRAGDAVEVRPLEEILATLDSAGTTDGMPFMPEMVKYCGRRFRVAKRAHKTCDTVNKSGGLKVREAVHLEDVRCDGSGHGGCQAACSIFWKEAWLKRVRSSDRATAAASEPVAPLPASWSCTTEHADGGDYVRYRCQATELPKFTTPLQWWDVRQYIEDVVSGNVGLGKLLRGLRYSLFRMYVTHGVGYRLIRAAYDRFQRWRGAPSFPFVTGMLTKTPHVELGLQPGEWVRVRNFDDIVGTLDTRRRNRGMTFDTDEMRLHCGKAYRVKDRVERIIDEKTGRMLTLANPCIRLAEVYCSAETTCRRLFCPRAITPYWREIWLERATAPQEAGSVSPRRGLRVWAQRIFHPMPVRNRIVGRSHP